MADRNLNDIIRDITPRLRSYVRSKVSNSDDADDIVQDTLYQFARTMSILDNPIGKVTSWLYTVAHNLVINYGKKKSLVIEAKPKKMVMDGDEDSFMVELSEIMAASDNEDPDVLMLRNMVWEELNKAMSELPLEQQRALQLTEIDGLSVKDAARLMGVPINTFLSRKHYAVKHIRRRLKLLYEELVHN